MDVFIRTVWPRKFRKLFVLVVGEGCDDAHD